MLELRCGFRWMSGVGSLALVAALLATPGLAAGTSSTTWSNQVLMVGTFDGMKGQYTNIQAAVNAAHRGDWILVAPGDYHERADAKLPSDPSQLSEGGFGGVLITKPGITIRGMDRNSVIVDGTKANAATPCSARSKAQNFGTLDGSNKPAGRNGIVVWKANRVSIENLTVCNFLGGDGYAGNGIWWNGGANSGNIGLKGQWGSYLTATSTYFQNESTAATYGIFSSNSSGGTWKQVYASNFNDSGMYVGACQQVCNMAINHAWMEYNALGYSGTNSGGTMVVKNSRFDHNEDGFDTNSAISGDGPGPQNGACPTTSLSSASLAAQAPPSCWVVEDNVFRNNNNINVPRAGSAAAGPTGTGMTVSGGRNDTIRNNLFENNGAWGILFVPYPDSGTPVLNQTCAGDGGVENGAFGCVFDPESDHLVQNTFKHNGYFGNPSNSDFGQITLSGGEPQNCYRGNIAPDGSAPSNLQQTQRVCGRLTKSGNTGGPLLGQVLCDTGFGSCPPGSNYPQPTKVMLHPLPKLPSMPNPCLDVPANVWCPSGKPA